MAKDERELEDGGGQAGADEQQAAPNQGEETGTRVDAAKAFFRALHAGGDSPAGDSGDSGSKDGPCLSCQRMEQQVGEAEQRAGEAEGLYRRMAADFENYRKRVDREREEFQAAGIQKAVESLLPALDDMDRAHSSLTAETPPDKLLESLNLVFNRINRCLELMGVKPLTCIGEHFDPKFHEPVQEIETTEFPDGAVMHELRRGYTLNDRVIRPALVNVAANSGSPAVAPVEAGGEEQESSEVDKTGQKVYDLTDYADGDSSDEAEQSSGKPAETT